ncbi:hypothetical protein IEO21_10036 [Rhodonia placenta]|uniref:CFA20 domain-containing protein n=1 Tax=Rhodonia placenta TaxID=104341 RepID=A0A8H7NTA6_9APHY|nr:hypothetical protein IEO21_10036 [Postia placenta]
MCAAACATTVSETRGKQPMRSVNYAGVTTYCIGRETVCEESKSTTLYIHNGSRRDFTGLPFAWIERNNRVSPVQPSLVSIFSSTGSEPLSTFLSSTDKSLPSDSFICFCNDATSLPHPRLPATLVSPSTNEQGAPDYALQQTVLHIQSPTLRTTFIRCPPFRDANGPSGHLGMKHPWIHFQVRNMGREFSLEIGLVDQSGREGVLEIQPISCVTPATAQDVGLLGLTAAPLPQSRDGTRISGQPIPRLPGILVRTETSAEQREPFLRMGNPPLLHLPLLLPSSSSRPLTSWCTINLNLPTLLTHFLSASLLRPDGDEDADLPDSDDDDGDVPLPTTSSASQRILQTRFNQVPAGTYSYVSYVKVYATCRLRRIWFSEDGPKQRLPWEFQLYAAD